MKSRSSDEIRQDFFDFFREKEHLIVKSAPVVPKDDPTLLFTNAGMNQFKPIFLGAQEGFKTEGKVWKRAADTQKCIRVSGKHNDLDEVGHDTYHHTLFEMLGNWSFGDYFKKEAIGWAWELLVGRWGLEPDRLYATVFAGDKEDGLPEDRESAELWESETDINPENILKFGKKDNFWEMGETGPCGPCSEVHIDLRPDEERKKVDGASIVNRDDPRVMEIWNLVFIQFNRQKDGSLDKLPARHVDTGMGFERICAVLQGVKSNYDTDIFKPLLNRISELSDRIYGDDPDIDISMRVIADHIRAVSFAIADGASPSNEGRGYVIRRILRRAVRYGWDRLEFKQPFFYKLVPVLADQFDHVFPELQEQLDYVVRVVKSEEESFLKTLGQGIELFNQMIDGSEKVSGEDAFKLHDTYGFPIDLTELMARERGVEVDIRRFDELMEEQKARGRASGKFGMEEVGTRLWNVVKKTGEFEFVGYDELETETEVRAYAREGEQNVVLLTRSPFYAESGGQIADTGVLKSGEEEIRVLNVLTGREGFLHITNRLPSNPKAKWVATVDRERRHEIEKHHTATHLMHAALRETLGDHVNQKGSLVAPDRLRFDFSHFEAVALSELNRIEARVNEKIQENIQKQEERDVPIGDAEKRGAMMLFGEKYGDRVRIISFDETYSVELCGGTHVGATGQIGYFRFTGETSVAAGIRRVEAVVGKSVDQYLRDEKQQLYKIRKLLEAQGNPFKQIESLIKQKKELEKELERMEQQQASGRLDELLQKRVEIGPAGLITGEVDGADMDTLKQMGYEALKKGTASTVTLLASKDGGEGKVYLMAAVSKDLIEKGIRAGDLVGDLGRLLGGGGGGQPNLATAGGRYPEKLNEAFDKAKELINNKL